LTFGEEQARCEVWPAACVELASSTELPGEGSDKQWPEGTDDEAVRLGVLAERHRNESADDRVRERDNEVSRIEYGKRLA
jgi:hypothetical protein